MSRFLRILLIETVQNIPLWMGFILSARLAERNAALGWGLLVAAMVGGAFAIAITEHLIAGGELQITSNPRDFLVNAVTFCAVGAIFMLYFTAGAALTSYRTDIILGVLLGLTISTAQGVAAADPIGEILTHGLALALAMVVTLTAVRFVLTQPRLLTVLVQSFALTVIASLIIAAVDYNSA
jgi:hypothetical protein